MIRYQKITGVSIGDNSLPTVHQTPEGRAMAAIPGWKMLIDPDYATSTGVRNRAAPSSVAPLPGGDLFLGEFENGAPAFAIPDDESGQIGAPIPGCDINPEGFSFFWVVSDFAGQAGRHYVLRTLEQEEGVIAPSIAMVRFAEEDWVTVYEDSVNATGRPVRLNLTLTGSERLTLSTPRLIMVTFSTAHGLSIYVDGEMKASDPSDTRPLNFGFNGDELAAFISLRAKMGMAGLLNIDLNAPENTGHRRAIEKFLMDKYGIPQGPQ